MFTIVTVVTVLFAFNFDWLLHPLTDSLKYTNIYLHALLVNLPRGAVANAALELIYRLCRYDILNTDDLYDDHLGFGNHESVSPRYE